MICSLGVTPEIRQNYSGVRKVFDAIAIHAWLASPTASQVSCGTLLLLVILLRGDNAIWIFKKTVHRSIYRMSHSYCLFQHSIYLWPRLIDLHSRTFETLDQIWVKINNCDCTEWDQCRAINLLAAVFLLPVHFPDLCRILADLLGGMAEFPS